jgi:uncharacterized membrane protein YfcA
VADFFSNAHALLFALAFFAGAVDAIAGGGGLIQVPALFVLFPGVPPATLLGTNKVASIFGTANAAQRYLRQIRLPWNAVLPAVLAALLFAFAGAYTVTQVKPDFLRAALPFILLALAIYTFIKKDFGQQQRVNLSAARERTYSAATGAGLGFYDGFFGPGTGSFLLFVFVRYFGFDFIRATAAAKVVNLACNFTAIAWFASAGHVDWRLGLSMALFNWAGSFVGSHLALTRGNRFVRAMFLAVLAALILKTGYDAWFHVKQ